MSDIDKEKARKREKKKREKEFADLIRRPEGLVPDKKKMKLTTTQKIITHLTSLNPPSTSEIAKLVGCSKGRVSQVRRMLKDKSREAVMINAQLRAELAEMHLESQRKIKDRLDLTNKVITALDGELTRLREKKVKGIPTNLVKKLAMIMKEDRQYIQLLLESLGHKIPDDRQANKTIAQLIDIFHRIINKLPTDLKEMALEELKAVKVVDADYEVIEDEPNSDTSIENEKEAASSADAGDSRSDEDASKQEDYPEYPEQKCCFCPKLKTDWPKCINGCEGPITKLEDVI